MLIFLLIHSWATPSGLLSVPYDFCSLLRILIDWIFADLARCQLTWFFPSMSPFFAILKSPFLLFSTMAFLKKAQLFYLTNICSLPAVCAMYSSKSLGRYQCLWWEGKKERSLPWCRFRSIIISDKILCKRWDQFFFHINNCFSTIYRKEFPFPIELL